MSWCLQTKNYMNILQSKQSNSRHLNFISIRGCVNGTFRQELWNWKNWALSWVFSKCNQFHDFTRFHVIFSRANATVWKNEKFSALQIFFRQINLIVKFFSLKKNLLSRNFCEILKFPHCATVWKNEKFSLTKEIFRQINHLATS